MHFRIETPTGPVEREWPSIGVAVRDFVHSAPGATELLDESGELLARVEEGTVVSLVNLRWYAILMDETSYWVLNGLKTEHKPRIESIYLFSPDAKTYICSLTPSLELHWVETRPAWDDAPSKDEQEHAFLWVEEGLHSCPPPRVDYFDLGDIRRPGVFSGDAEGPRWAFVGEANDETFEDLFEHVRGNSPL